MSTTTQLATTQDAPRKPGAPLGNTNRIRHGMRGSSLPRNCRHIESSTNKFRLHCEQAVLDARGEIVLTDAIYINTAFRAERHAQLAQRWLFLKGDAMSDGDRLAYSREVVKASAERDKAVAALRLDAEQRSDVWATLHQNAVEARTRDAGEEAQQ